MVDLHCCKDTLLAYVQLADSFLQRWSPANLSLDCSFPTLNPGLSFCLCWAPWDPSWTLTSFYQAVSEWQLCLPVQRAFPTLWGHQLTEGALCTLNVFVIPSKVWTNSDQSSRGQSVSLNYHTGHRDMSKLPHHQLLVCFTDKQVKN